MPPKEITHICQKEKELATISANMESMNEKIERIEWKIDNLYYLNQ